VSKIAIQEKSVVVDQIIEKIKNAPSLVIIDYQGLTVFQDTKFRNMFRANGVEYKVLKNTLLRRALNSLGYNQFDKDLEGPTAVAFASTDMAAPAKIVGDAIREFKKIKVKCGLVDGTYLDAEGVNGLANMPSKEVLIAKLLGTMLAPVTGLASVLNQTIAALPRVLQAAADKMAN
jgi:large subunit ribosomal protein L10